MINLYSQCGGPFLHGVASGDALSDKIIIWTRVTPVTPGAITVHWRMAKDTGMTQVVRSGVFITGDSIDYTVKVDVKGLTPNTYYYYQFETGGSYSVRGRTHTMPATGLETQRFAIVSCQNWEDGYFNAYNRIAARNDISAIIFLGDYIYEYKTGDFSSNIPGRKNNPLNECTTLKDYRTRYAQYHTDTNLARCHQQYPWMIVWDDHEFANDAYKNGAENHQPGSEGDWDLRKANAMKAWKEWLPVMVPNNTEQPDQTRIYRKISVGGLINFYLLDTRIIARTKQLSVLEPGFDDTTRYLLGKVQMNCLLDDMQTSTAKWNIVCQQVMVAPLTVFGVPVNTDSWDGYPAERDRLMKGLKDRDIKNAVILTGDFHTSWGSDLPTDNYNVITHTGSAAVEFVTTSVTSQNFSLPVPDYLIKALNLHVQYVDITHHGYLLLDVKTDRTTGEWYYVPTVTEPSQGESLGAVYYVQGTRRHLVQANKATIPVPVPAPLAPSCSQGYSNTAIVPTQSTGITSPEPELSTVYPNPFSNELNIEFTSGTQNQVMISLTDMMGKVLLRKMYMPSKGINRTTLSAGSLPAGNYVLSISNAQGTIAHKLVSRMN